jgi:hypothetical protein
MRIKHQILLLASKDTDEKLVEMRRSEALTTTVIRSDCTMLIHESRVIPKETTDAVIPLGAITTGKFLYLETDKEITVKFNAESTGHKVTSASGLTAKLLLDGEFTAFKITNASTTEAANVTYLIGGV